MALETLCEQYKAHDWPAGWPERPPDKEKPISDEVFESDAPRTLALAKPARALPNPPPPPVTVFRKLSIQKPKPTHTAPLQDAVFIRKITVQGLKPAPLLLRKPATTPAPAKPSPAPGAKFTLKRSAEPEI